MSKQTAALRQSSPVRLIPGGARIIVRPDAEGFDESAFGDEGPKVVKKGGKFYTEGGIEIPQNFEDQVKRRALTGTIEHCGPVMTMEFADGDGPARYLRKGDRVLFGQYAGTQLERQVPGYESVVIMTEDDVIALVEGM